MDAREKYRSTKYQKYQLRLRIGPWNSTNMPQCEDAAVILIGLPSPLGLVLYGNHVSLGGPFKLSIVGLSGPFKLSRAWGQS